jgi:hypothetical protein
MFCCDDEDTVVTLTREDSECHHSLACCSCLLGVTDACHVLRICMSVPHTAAAQLPYTHTCSRMRVSSARVLMPAPPFPCAWSAGLFREVWSLVGQQEVLSHVIAMTAVTVALVETEAYTGHAVVSLLHLPCPLTLPRHRPLSLALITRHEHSSYVC